MRNSNRDLLREMKKIAGKSAKSGMTMRMNARMDDLSKGAHDGLKSVSERIDGMGKRMNDGFVTMAGRMSGVSDRIDNAAKLAAKSEARIKSASAGSVNRDLGDGEGLQDICKEEEGVGGHMPGIQKISKAAKIQLPT